MLEYKWLTYNPHLNFEFWVQWLGPLIVTNSFVDKLIKWLLLICLLTILVKSSSTVILDPITIHFLFLTVPCYLVWNHSNETFLLSISANITEIHGYHMSFIGLWSHKHYKLITMILMRFNGCSLNLRKKTKSIKKINTWILIYCGIFFCKLKGFNSKEMISHYAINIRSKRSFCLCPQIQKAVTGLVAKPRFLKTGGICS